MSGGKSVKMSEGNYATLKELKHLYKVDTIDEVVDKIISELAGQDKYDEFYRLLVEWGVNEIRAKGIVRMWRHYSVDDVMKLREIMVTASVPERVISVIVEGWRMIVKDEIKSAKAK